MRDIVYHISRWVFSVAIVCLAVYLFYSQVYLVYGPKVADMDARLPTFLHPSPLGFWVWLVGAGASGGLTTAWTVRTFRRLRHPAPPVDEMNETDADAELTRAGEAIAHLRLGHDGDPVFLLIATAEAAGPSGPTALLAAGGMPPDALAPDDPTPIRGYRTAEGLFLRCSGPDTRAASHLAQLLPTLAGAPRLRGVVVQVPVALLMGTQGRGFGVATRALLRAVAESTATRCPAYVVITGMEAVPGFLEFAHRTPAEYRTSARFGFSLPGGLDPSSALVAREYDRLVAWYQPSILDMMESRPLDQDGNEALFALGRWFLRAREPVLQFLDATRPGGDDPLELLNCYFAATGEGADRRAFAEGVLRGKVAGDSRAARWSARTLAGDQRLERLAVGLGVVGGLGAVLAWTLIFSQLRPSGWSEVLLAVGIVGGWIATWFELIRGFRRPNARPGPRPRQA